MSTPSLVPIADNQGGVGTAAKRWALGWINALVINTIKIVSGAVSGYFLTSDADGNANWTQTLPVGNGGTGATTAVQALINLGISAALVFEGTKDCSTQPNYPAATAGWVWIVSVAGKIGGSGGVSVNPGDQIICSVNNGGGTQAQVGADFTVVSMGTSYQAASANLTTYAGIAPSSDAQTLLTENFAQMLASLGVQNPAVGEIHMYGGSSPPTGWLLCDGSAISRTTYATLFGVLSTTYGAGNGSSTFNLPDFRGRIPTGVGTGTGGGASGTGLPAGGSALTAVARGTWKGEEAHQLSEAELASHTHAVDPPNTGTSAGGYHSHGYTAPGGNVTVSQAGQYLVDVAGPGGGATTDADGYHDHAVDIGSFASGGAGSGTAHNNIQPIMGVNFIIKY